MPVCSVCVRWDAVGSLPGTEVPGMWPQSGCGPELQTELVVPLGHLTAPWFCFFPVGPVFVWEGIIDPHTGHVGGISSHILLFTAACTLHIKLGILNISLALNFDLRHLEGQGRAVIASVAECLTFTWSRFVYIEVKSQKSEKLSQRHGLGLSWVEGYLRLLK